MILLLLAACAVIGLLGLILGIKFGMKIGREMAEAKIIDHTNRHPLDYAYEVSDTLYPDRTDIMIEVPDYHAERLIERLPILRRHWSLN